jgi:hypothetical protein
VVRGWGLPDPKKPETTGADNAASHWLSEARRLRVVMLKAMLAPEVSSKKDPAKSAAQPLYKDRKNGKNGSFLKSMYTAFLAWLG